MKSFTVGIFVFEQVEVLDFAGPFEVFTTASRVASRSEPEAPPRFRVLLLGQSSEPSRARAGLWVTPDHSLAAHPPLDVLLVPGGDVSSVREDAAVARWIAATDATTRITASVCTGAFLLAKAGLLSGKSCTTHWEDVEDLSLSFPDLNVKTGVRWIDEGKIVTSAGISAGIDMSLHLVERLADRTLAMRTARQMEFDWTENPPIAK